MLYIVYCVLFIVFQAAYQAQRSCLDESFILWPSKTYNCVSERTGNDNLKQTEEEKWHPLCLFWSFSFLKAISFFSQLYDKKAF